MHRCLASFVLLLSLGVLPGGASAAESFDGCAGFIESLPATITTQGTWCLRRDLSTAITSGAAIQVNTNNVTIDCNDFKLGGLAAGNASATRGIRAEARTNVAVRNCNVRGFAYGIYLDGLGHRVVDNVLDNNLWMGIYVGGSNNQVRGNSVFDTGGPANGLFFTAIQAGADIIDNTVDGVHATSPSAYVYGIYATAQGTEIRNNRVRDLNPSGTGQAFGIQVLAPATRIADNHVANYPAIHGTGIDADGETNSFCRGNTVSGFSIATITDCRDLGGNVLN